MKRRIKALLMALIMVVSVVASGLGDVTVFKADEQLVIKLHYNRPDGDYTDWDVWFWEVGGEGDGYAFAEENGDMVATKVVSPGVSEVGYIVRTAGWGAKDVEEDQFLDVAKYISGTLHLYVESGVPNVELVEGDDIKTGSKLISAEYKEAKAQIYVKIAGEVGDKDTAFKVYDPSGKEIKINLVAFANAKYILNMDEELDLMSEYTITFKDQTYYVTMPDYYSTKEFESQYTYDGNDLGATWSKDSTTFKVWAPTASAVKLNLYKSGTHGTDDLIEQIEMTKGDKGVWSTTKSGDLNGTYYTYSVTNKGTEKEACDPYAKTTGVNGKRAMVIDMASTNPEGWADDKNPQAGKNITDAVIYELHIRDLSSDKSSGITNVGKFLGLTEHGTKTEGGKSTGIDHIKNLGITHIHILPMYDYGSVDESKLDTPQFNWGYDPVNYNVPEGSYSTDPTKGEVRVKEVKQMVQSLHNDGIAVIMDVVYNHVYSASGYCYNQIVPDYFTRPGSNGSGCGNDVASERAMVHKYIVESVKYWADEYHIDGFRFDLVGLIDTDTINAIIEEVHKTHPDVIFYGEGWTMSTKVTKEGYTMTTQTNAGKVPQFGFFSDTIRNALKGGVFSVEKGFVSGAQGLETTIEGCFYGKDGGWSKSPSQAIHYASCHDNFALYDTLVQARPDASKEDIIKMNNLAASIYMLAEGVPFLQAGEEILRSKPNEDGTYNHNSYNSPDSVNSIKWSTLEDEAYQGVYDYYKGLIAFRKAHPVLRLAVASDVNQHVTTLRGLGANVVGFDIDGSIEGEHADRMYILYNANASSTTVDLPEGDWNVYVKGNQAGVKCLETVSGTVTVEGISAMVLVQEPFIIDVTDDTTDDANTSSVNPIVLPIVVGVVAVVAIAAVSAVIIIKKRKEAGL